MLLVQADDSLTDILRVFSVRIVTSHHHYLSSLSATRVATLVV